MSILKNTFRLNRIFELINANCVTYSLSQDDPGTLWGWGLSNQGQPGSNTYHTQCRSSPVQVPGTQWTRISRGPSDTFFAVFGTKCDNTLWSWGYNGGYGLLGNNTRTGQRSSPVQIPGTTWYRVSSGGGTLALKTDYSLWAWGENTVGILGQNNVIHRSSPVQIPGNSWCEISTTTSTNASIKTDGTLWTWGSNACGNLGLNTSSGCVSSPVQVPGTQWTSLFSDCGSFAALKTDGTVWAWGARNCFPLNNVHTSSPTQVPGTWLELKPGGGYVGLGIKNDNTLWTAGSNYFGSLGINVQGNTPGTPSGTALSSPIQIPGLWLTGTVTNLGGVMALKADCTLWAWGNGCDGFTGTDSITRLSSPVQVPGTWIGISCGFGHYGLARKT